MNPFDCVLSLLRSDPVSQDCANRAQVFGALWPVVLLIFAALAAVATKTRLSAQLGRWLRSQIARVPYRMVKITTTYRPVVYLGPQQAVVFDGIRVVRGQTIELTDRQIARLREQERDAVIERVLYRYVGNGNRIGSLPLRDLTEADWKGMPPEYRAAVETDPHGLKVYERVND